MDWGSSLLAPQPSLPPAPFDSLKNPNWMAGAPVGGASAPEPLAAIHSLLNQHRLQLIHQLLADGLYGIQNNPTLGPFRNTLR